MRAFGDGERHARKSNQKKQDTAIGKQTETNTCARNGNQKSRQTNKAKAHKKDKQTNRLQCQTQKPTILDTEDGQLAVWLWVVWPRRSGQLPVRSVGRPVRVVGLGLPLRLPARLHHSRWPSRGGHPTWRPYGWVIYSGEVLAAYVCYFAAWSFDMQEPKKLFCSNLFWVRI